MYCYKHDLIVIMSLMSLIMFMYDKVCYNEIYMLWIRENWKEKVFQEKKFGRKSVIL